MTAEAIKTELLKHCQKQVDNRYFKIKQIIETLEESLLEESKNSSGDKHETGRAMLQIERENAGNQLREIEKLLQLLKKIDIETASDYARLGSLIYTDGLTYFISISTGMVSLENLNYCCIALHSPVGMLLSGKKKGEMFTFRGEVHKITEVL